MTSQIITNLISPAGNVAVPIIGVHRSPLGQKFGTPRQSGLVALPSVIVMHAPFTDPAGFAGIEHASHLWITWYVHKNRAPTNATFRPKVRPPRFGGNSTMGVFATRSPYRPSALGLSVVTFSGIDFSAGTCLHIQGADFIDGTPIVDIKPYLPYSDALGHATSTLTKPLNHPVIVTDRCQIQLDTLVQTGLLSAQDLVFIVELIAQDPRPAYRKTQDSPFAMRYQAFDVVFFANKESVLIVDNITYVG